MLKKENRICVCCGEEFPAIEIPKDDQWLFDDDKFRQYMDGLEKPVKPLVINRIEPYVSKR